MAAAEKAAKRRADEAAAAASAAEQKAAADQEEAAKADAVNVRLQALQEKADRARAAAEKQVIQIAPKCFAQVRAFAQALWFPPELRKQPR